MKKVWEVPWTVEKKGEGIWGGGGGSLQYGEKEKKGGCVCPMKYGRGGGRG